MHTSNQASSTSSVPPAIAVRLARRSPWGPRPSSAAVASAAAPSAASRPVQASAQ
ncbi:MAG TPA: hypothetical protein VHU92_07340 [Streptosporangiaceae bacterium]|nr:hypothetical protein [Streptosporangiaceae bacterium]